MTGKAPWRLPAVLAAVSLTLAFASPVRAQDTSRCGLSLVLAIDVSSSVSAPEFSLQMVGLADALNDAAVRQAIRDIGGIQVTAYEWSGRYQQVDIAPWTFLFADGDIAAFAERLRNHRRGYDDFPTAIGYALGYGATQLARAPLACSRKVIDVSGDGVNNEGFEPRGAYDSFPFDNVQVNALVIAGAKPDPIPYYREKVLFGAGAFLEIAGDFADYRDAMRRKLLREILGSALSYAR